MIFKLHYWFLASGANAIGILLGVFLETYTDANAIEIGALYMLMPFTGIIFRPIICSKADREQAHQHYLILCLLVTAVGYVPFVVIPLLGPTVYVEHSRACWYIFVVLKVVGDIAFGGVISIGDSLAINYSKRIGVEFSVYRVWGTISWMVFGVVIGQINEVSFLPKYVPGFLILITSSLLDLTIIWLWPREYFVMVAEPESQVKGAAENPQSTGNLAKFTKSLMPKHVVIAHMKRKLRSLLTCLSGRSGEQAETAKPSEIPDITVNGAPVDNKSIDSLQQVLSKQSMSESNRRRRDERSAQTINKMTQFRILMLLLRRDPRIVLYLLYFVGAGLTVAPIGFFVMSLSSICHEQGTCDFSVLAGLIQVSMALAETTMFVYIKRIQAKIGRVNTCSIAFLLATIQYCFYATVWTQVSPYYTLLFECARGAAFGIYLTMMVELGHKFAREVRFIVPELTQRGIVRADSDSESLKLSLAATMQSLIASAMDGIGRGVGALVYGFVLHHYSFQALWLVVACIAISFLLGVVGASVLDKIFDFRLGLDLAPDGRPADILQVEANEIGSPGRNNLNSESLG